MAPLFALPILSHSVEHFDLTSGNTGQRDFAVCINPDLILKDPDMLNLLSDAGISAIWIATYFYGYWPYDVEKIARARKLVMKKGMKAFAITIPFGHPGDSLNAGDEQFPLISPSHWPRSTSIDGKLYAGTSVNELVNTENAKALKQVSTLGFGQCMMDDDFRIARLPGVIGGSFDNTTRNQFLKEGGYSENSWNTLLENIRERKLTPMVRNWIEGYCDQLTHSYQVQQKAFDGDLGFMVMYLGAEKAGIRLADFKNVSMRVGEAHFSDKSFATPRGWTNELFSVLFHRRFIKPEKAWSETTAFPANELSAAHMAAKLIISTIADVRHTLFMSGLEPIPETHWSTLSAAVKMQRSYHKRIAGHQPRGPFKHYWGEASRYIGRDNPFSLWLALGVPFEVIGNIGKNPDGWIFLTDEDYDHLSNNQDKQNWIVRAGVKHPNDNVVAVKEDLAELWKWRRAVIPALEGKQIPYIIDELPAVCAWYPDASCVLVWSLSTEPVSLRIQYGNQIISQHFQPLEAKLVMG
ncbi:MAG TPA: hypothetical protein PKV73_15320 [Agriterribacter sp.]|nr:hypothetical protein [Agriterribacter sp.]